MKEYTFNIPVIGAETVTVKAEDLTSALTLLHNGCGDTVYCETEWESEPDAGNMTVVQDL